MRFLCLPLVLLFACSAELPIAGDGDGDDGEPGPDDLEGDDYEAAPTPSTLTDNQISIIDDRIDGILGQPQIGPSQSVIVVDLESGQTVYEMNPDQLLIPASNTKLFTSAAAMGALGAQHRMMTRGFATGALTNGVLAGDLVVVANHDFTPSTYFYPNARLPIDRFADALHDAGLRRIDGELLLAGEMLYQGYNFGSYNAINARAAAAVQLEAALVARGIETGVLGTTPSFTPPQGSTLFAEHGSAPLSVAFVPLNVISHNEFADISLRHIGSELGGESSYAAGEREVLTYLDAIGIDTTGLAFKDGSGLSRQNRVSARVVAALLAKVLESPEGPSWMRTLTIAGVRGTLGNRMSGVDTAGRFFGKTGTLNGVIATSGVLFNRHDGRRYLVSALMNGVGSNSASRSAQDQIVGAVAGDIRGAPAPTAPTLLSARNDASNLAVLEWSAVDGADAYVVWFSRDGASWSRDNARLVESTQFRADGLDEGVQYARVTAYSESSGESEPSDVYTLTQTRYASRVLLVDGNDRYQAAPAIENPSGRAHDFARAYGEVVGGHGLDTVANEAVESGAIDLGDYEVVIWMLGEESTVNSTLSAAEQNLIRSYLGRGGKLLISGSELGWDLVAEGDASDAAFFRDVLKSDYVADDAGTYAANGIEGDMGRLDFYNPGLLDVAFADVLAPTGSASVLLEYESGGAAAIAFAGDGHHVINVGFPIEALDADDVRLRLLGHAMNRFGL